MSINIRSIIESVDLNEGVLNESSFSASKLKKVSDLLAIVMGNQLGGEFKLLGGSLGEESFKKKGFGEGKGFKYMNNKGQMIRFGWLKSAKKSKFQINIVDFWDPRDGKKRWDTPTTTVRLADWLNIVDVVQELKTVLVTGSTDSIKESEQKASVSLMEAKEPGSKLIAYAASKGVEYQGPMTPYKFIQQLKDEGVWDEAEYKGYSVVSHTTEKNSTEDVFKGAEKKLAEKKWSDPELVFGDIEKLTKIVATGGANGLIVAGMAGMGKCLCEETQIPVFGI